MRKNILFMCVANSARSQLAEALAKQHLLNCNIESAGSHPSKVNSYAIKVLLEEGIDISGSQSKSVSDLSQDFVENLDYVITLCAEEVCPVILSKAKRLHWPMPDPATKDALPDEVMLERFRMCRSSIKLKIEEFSKQLRSEA